MRSLAIGIALLTLGCASAFAQEPTGKNCLLLGPPETAGESQSHGAMLRVYPRAKEIGPDYSGCQTVWAGDGANWSVFAKTQVRSGDPVRVWIPDGAYTSCRYRRGKLIAGRETECAHPEFLLMKSFPAGCVAKLHEAASKGALGVLPVGCELE
jgi:hypothetical protein